MEKETTLAREEREWGVLLADTGYNSSGEDTKSNHLSRPEAISTNRGAEEETTINTEKKSSNNAKNKNRSGRKAKPRTGNPDSLGWDAGEAETGDSSTRRSAEELGLKYPSPVCPDSPNNAHFFSNVRGEIFRCKHCGVYKWQPMTWAQAQDFSTYIRTLGIEKAYYKALNKSPRAKAALYRLKNNKSLDSATQILDECNYMNSKSQSKDENIDDLWLKMNDRRAGRLGKCNVL